MPRRGASHLKLKSGSYFYRARVPQDLAERIGPEVSKALHTKNRREAERLAKAYAKEMDTAYAMVRSGLIEGIDDVKTWVRSRANKALAKLQAEVDDALMTTTTIAVGDDVAAAYDEVHLVLAEAVDNGEDWAIEQALRMAGEDTETIPPELRRRVAVLAVQALRHLDYRPILNRPLPTPAAPSPPDSLGDLQRTLDDLVTKVNQQGQARDPKTLGEALESFAAIKAEKRGEAIDDTKANDLYRTPARFVEHMGAEKPMDEVTTENVLDWLDTLVDTRSKTPKPIGSGTRNKTVGSLSTIFDEAVQRGWALSNPAKGLRVVRRRKAHERRQPFEIKELQRILTRELRSQVERGYPERWWVPAMMLFNGTRTNEACQLKLRDVVEVDGIPCLRILPEDATQSTKTEESDRIVPIHPRLIELGLLDYIHERKRVADNDPDALLWPNLTYRTKGGYSTKVVNFFSGARGYLQQLGLREDQRKTLYSLRHTFATQAERAGMSDIARTQLMGHARRGDMGKQVYISDRQADELLAELEKVDWGEALSNLR